MARKVWIVQRPKHGDNFDMEAVKALGEVEYLLPSAPNVHDKDRITADVKHMAEIIRDSKADDIFIWLSGSPVSMMAFGAAYILSEKERPLNYGLFSRGQDEDGRRGGQTGSYRIVPVDLYADLPNQPLAATAGQGAQ